MSQTIDICEFTNDSNDACIPLIVAIICQCKDIYILRHQLWMYQNLVGDTQGKANEYDKEGITNEFQPPGADFIKLFCP